MACKIPLNTSQCHYDIRLPDSIFDYNHRILPVNPFFEMREMEMVVTRKIIVEKYDLSKREYIIPIEYIISQKRQEYIYKFGEEPSLLIINPKDSHTLRSSFSMEHLGATFNEGSMEMKYMGMKIIESFSVKSNEIIVTGH